MKAKNLPVKYALFPVEIIKTAENGENYNAISGYMVSKVFLLKEIKKYEETGESSFEYEVLFPYATFPILQRDGNNQICIILNGEPKTVSMIFDDYEEAKAYRNNVNTLYEMNDIHRFLLYESVIEDLNKDMLITGETKHKQKSLGRKV